MKKVKTDYGRLTDANIFKYLKEEYNAQGIVSFEYEYIADFIPLAQKDYGDLYDCTLTSLTATIYYILKKKVAVNVIYDVVEKIAKRHLYDGNKTGTYSIFIKKIFDKSLQQFVTTKKINSKQSYFKKVGYGYTNICKQIDNKNPVLLSLWNDGRNYYKNHTVTIIGYRNFKVDGKQVRMLVIYDNWYKTRAYIDYEKLPAISSINYL